MIISALTVRGGGTRTLWRDENRRYVDVWDARRGKIVIGMPADELQEARLEYMDWNTHRTQMLIGNPTIRQHEPEGINIPGMFGFHILGRHSHCLRRRCGDQFRT